MKKNILYRFLVFVNLLFISGLSYGQISYSCDMEENVCEAKWDNNGFDESPTGSCTGNAIKDNVWGSDATVAAWNNASTLTGHTGGDLRIQFDYVLREYNSATATPTVEWGELKVYYKSSIPSEADPGTLVHTISSIPSTGCHNADFTFTPSGTIGDLYICFLYTHGSGDNDIVIDELSITEITGPTITTSSSSLTNLNYCSGAGPSTSQNFTVSGSSLTADITVTAPTNYEVSTDNSAFSASVVLSETAGSVGSTTIYTRLKTGLSVGSYTGGTIDCTSTGATTKTTSVSGTVGSSTIYLNDGVDDGTELWCTATIGNDANDGLTVTTPFLSVSAALTYISTSVCAGTHTVYIDAGTYADENISIPDNTDDVDFIGAGKTLTIFDGDNTDDWLTINSGGNTSGLLFSDMTVKEYGGTAQQDGGAIRHLGGTGIVFQDMIFETNRAYYSTNGGGVIYIANAAAVEFDRCIMRGNWSDYNGSVVLHSGSGALTMKNCLIYENDSDNGGDIYIENGSPTVNLYSITVADNTGSSSYGSVSCWTGTCNAYNSIFYNNESDYDVWDNSGTMTTYYCIFDAADGVTNNEVVGSPTFRSAVNDDYTLKYGSTGINAGDDTHVSGITSDLNGDNRTNSTTDLGAYEWNCDAASGGTVLSSSTVCSNTTTSMTVYGYEGQYWKWQSSDDNAAWSDIGSSDVNAYTTPALTATTYYRTAGSCDNTTWAYSSSVTKTVNHITYYVNDGSTSGDVFGISAFDGSGDGSSGDPFGTLASALAVATCGDTIKVDAGTYTEENITIPDNTDEIYIMGAGRTLTIFDGDNTDDWLTFNSGGNTSGITITDMTVKEYGGSVSQHGGALRILGGTSIVFEDVIFTANRTASASYYGALAYIENAASVDFNRCNINNNISAGRASVYYDASTGTVNMYNCLVYENDASTYGDFYSNNGGGASTITNCTFADNGAQTSGIDAAGEVWSIFDGTFIFNNCIFYNNATGYDIYENYESVTLNNCMYDAVSNRSLVANNTEAGTPTFTNAASDDYTLDGASTGINAGNNTYVSGISYDLDGNARIANTTVDLGCYELAVNTWDGSASSDWKTAANWSLGTIPVNETTIIPTSGSYTNPPIIDEADAVCGSLSLEGDAILTVSSGKLTVTGSVDMASTSEIQFDGGELECSGKFSADGILDINSGTLDVDGEFEVGSTLTEEISGGTIEVEGDFDGASEGDGDFTPTGGTVVLNGGSATTVDNHSSATFYNLTLDQAGVKSSSGSITVSNDFTINSGSQLTQSANRLTLGGNVDISGTLNHSGGNDIYLTGSSKTLSGTGTQTTANYMLEAGSNYNLTDDWSINSLETWTGGATLSVATTKTLTIASTFYTRTNASITLTGSANMTIGGDAWMAHEAGAVFNLNSGVLDLNGANATICGASGTFNANSGTIRTSATTTSISGTFNEGTSTFEYDGTTQNVVSDTYYNLTITAAGTKTAGGNIDVDGDLTTAATATCALDLTTYDLNVAGDLTVGATDGLDASDASCLVTIDGSGDQSITHAGSTGGTSAVTLVSEDFTSTSTGVLTEVVSTSSTYQIVDNCTTEKWDIEASDGSNAGTCTGCSGNRATIEYQGSSCTQDNTIKTKEFSPSTTSLDISFNYSVNHYGGQYFEVYLYNETDGAQVGADLINITSTVNSQTYSATTSLSGTNSTSDTYTLNFHYYGNNDWGCQFDNVLIQEDIAYAGADIGDITIAKGSGDLILSSGIVIDGTITMSTGDINLNGYNIDLSSTGEISGETNSDRIFGTSGVITTTRTINAPTALDAGGMGLAITSSANFGSTTIYRGHATQTNGTGTSISRYYSISPTTNTGLDATIVMSYFDNELGTHTEADLALFRSTDGGTNWTNRGGTVNTGANTITLAGIDAFSLWVPSDEVAQPLPIQLVTFDGIKEGYANKLKWTTASEKNNDYFTVEKTIDGETFEEVGNVQGAGNSIYYNSYSLFDQNIEKILNYYRLVQTDFDGEKTYSDIISIDNREGENKDKTLIQITNTWGQEVNDDYIGVVIYIYSDGSIERVFKN